MRWVYIATVVIFTLAILIFMGQNFEIVTMNFLGFRARVPLAVLAVIFYVAGALSGGGLFALLRDSFQKSKFDKFIH
ncbi:MAG: hypothetical protein JNK47_22290 [Mesorhizobium sp.]|nr:hypothetical protein [Mesorhizobium sp.]MBL8579944.1 hypothetical protein [Mesorhizobium sp.]